MVVAALFWPGVPMFDTVAQYSQVLSNDVDDWHPPVMVRLWQLLEPLGTGAGPMFVLQIALYAAGFALIVAALARSGRRWSALAAGLLAISPLLLGWQMVVLKDGQMLGALLAASGIVVHYRLTDRPIPHVAVLLIVLLLGYATLVRANALFATVPFAVMLLPRPASMMAKSAIGFAAIIVILGVMPVADHRLFDASSSGVAKSQPLFDLAAIATTSPHSVPPFTAAERAQILRKHCVKAYFWDPVADPSACGPVTARANALPEKVLYIDLARAAVGHPLAYASHRLQHWNSTERWLVPAGLIDGGPPDEAEPNDEGLATPDGPFVPAWQRIASVEAETPLGWPIVWTTLSLLLLPIAWRRRAEVDGRIAFALITSSVALEGSFLVISIASDLRYHLWSMTASALAFILLAKDLKPTSRAWLASCGLLAAVIAAGIAVRVTQPMAPDSYEAMIHAPSG